VTGVDRYRSAQLNPRDAHQPVHPRFYLRDRHPPFHNRDLTSKANFSRLWLPLSPSF
jgi:hypothetical protein